MKTRSSLRAELHTQHCVGSVTGRPFMETKNSTRQHMELGALAREEAARSSRRQAGRGRGDLATLAMRDPLDPDFCCRKQMAFSPRGSGAATVVLRIRGFARFSTNRRRTQVAPLQCRPAVKTI